MGKKNISEIGIPSFMFHHEFGSIFHNFFLNLGIRVIASPATDMQMYNHGKKMVIDEFCFPVKIYCSHVLYLQKQGVKNIFIPIIIGSEDGNSFLCFNQVRMFDIVRNLNIIDADSIVSASFHYNDNGILNDKGFYSLGEKLGFKKNETERALIPVSEIILKEENEIISGRPTIGITGKSYLVHDDWASMELKKKLKNLNCNVVTGRDFSGLNKSTIEKSHFTLADKVMFEIIEMEKSSLVDGIIFLLPFNCGPDCGIEFAAKEAGIVKPFLIIVMDELSGDAGLVTRIEAFLDMIRHKGNIR